VRRDRGRESNIFPPNMTVLTESSLSRKILQIGKIRFRDILWYNFTLEMLVQFEFSPHKIPRNLIFPFGWISGGMHFQWKVSQKTILTQDTKYTFFSPWEMSLLWLLNKKKNYVFSGNTFLDVGELPTQVWNLDFYRVQINPYEIYLIELLLSQSKNFRESNVFLHTIEISI